VTSQELLERVVELAAECRDEGMSGGQFVSTVAYRLGHVSQFSAPSLHRPISINPPDLLSLTKALLSW
jgi:hypothetical protein